MLIVSCIFMLSVLFMVGKAYSAEAVLNISVGIISVQDARNTCCFEQPPQWCFEKMIYHLYKTPFNEVLDDRRDTITADDVACYIEELNSV